MRNMYVSRMKSICVLLAIAIFLSPVSASADLRLFTIGSGDLSGGYFATARAICKAFNASDDSLRRCTPEPTVGSIYNLSVLRSGELDFALVQSDWQRAAYEGSGLFSEFGPMRDLRSVISLYPETITILASPNSGIARSADLAGRTVDIGRPSSGRHATVRNMLSQMGLDIDFFGAVREYEAGYAITELCEDRIDAAIFVVGHPNNIVANTLENCDASIIPLAGPNVDRMEDQQKDYQKVRIDLGLYGMDAEGIDSLAVIATLVTRASIENDLVADLVQAIRGEMDNLTGSFPLLRNLDWHISSGRGLTAPQHPGAARALSTEPD